MSAAEREANVVVSAGEVELEGTLTVPPNAAGVVLFAHGSGSSRYSPRNRFVAAALHEAGLATLLTDLLSPGEEEFDAVTAELRFDIGLLAGRLAAASDWLGGDERTRGLPLGYFGASTGAAAALVTAAERPGDVGAVVSRGGRVDLAVNALPAVRAPTLMIVGELDDVVRRANEQVLDLLPAEKRLEIVPGATHLFEEEGALERVSALARGWFSRHLRAHGAHQDR